MTREYQEPLTASPAVIAVDPDAQIYFTTGFILFQLSMVVLAVVSHIYLRRRTLQSQAAALRRGGGGFAAMDAPGGAGGNGRGGFPASLAGVGSVLANMTLSSNMFATPTTNAPATNGALPQQSPSSAGGGVFTRNVVVAHHQRSSSGTSLVEMTSAGSTSHLHGDLVSPTTASRNA